jgi:hypothetical protein
MRIACVYKPRLHTGCGKFHFVSDALGALGHSVFHAQTLDDLRYADSNCDFLLFEQRGPAELCLPDLRDFLTGPRKSACIQWFFDLNIFDDSLPVKDQAPVAPFLEVMQGMDLVLVKERDRLNDYADAGIVALWFDQGCPSTMRQAVLKQSPEFDVVLWGSASRPLWKQRWNDVDCLCRMGFKVGWFTDHGEPLPNGCIRRPGYQPLELPEVIEQGKVTLCVDAVQHIDGYWSDRIWLAAGAGACIIRRDNRSIELRPGEPYTSEAALVEIAKRYCADFRERRSCGEFARCLTLPANSYESRCEQLVNHAQRLIDQRHAEQNVPALQGV